MLEVTPLKPKVFSLAEFSRQTLLDRYMIEGEIEPEEAFSRCALAFSDNQAHAERMHGYFAKKWLGPATPPLANAPVRLTWGETFEDNFKAKHYVNVKGPMPISCFLNMPDDSRESLAAHYTECVWLGSNGGGVGAGWGNIREANAPTSNGQKSGGMIPFVGVIDRLALAVAQGSNRRFAYAAYLTDTHPELEEFIALRNTGGDDNRRSRNIHIGVLVTDKLMLAGLADADWDLISPSTGLVKSTVKARVLLESMLMVAVEKKGEPFLIFIDAMNRGLPKTQKAKGLQVHTSNLCVAPETKILTDKGHVEIASVVNQQVKAWNGGEYSQVTVRQTGADVLLLKVTTVDSLNQVKTLRCTPEHKWYLQDGTEVRTNQLKTGQLLLEWSDVDGEPHADRIVAVEVDQRSNTYCFTEPKKHMGVFNGLLTGQCTEISLATSVDRTAVCCLSSVNIDMVGEWKNDPLFIEDCIRFLDNILQYFIENAPRGMEKAVYSAKMERSIGLGSMGWHSYMQRQGIPYQSATALGVSHKYSLLMKEKALAASKVLAKERGEPEDMVGTGLRNAHCLTLAPTATNSIICNSVSPGGDIFFQNEFSHRTLSGVFKVRNAHLETLLESRGFNTPALWKQIGARGGSVQWMTDYLTAHEREVYLTAKEIDMAWHIDHYAMRQPHICQAQSLNLNYPSDVSRTKVLSDTYRIWRSGGKSRYYIRTEAIKRAEGVGSAIKRAEILGSDCVSCEG